MCLSEETIKTVGLFCLVSKPGEVNYHTERNGEKKHCRKLAEPVMLPKNCSDYGVSATRVEEDIRPHIISINILQVQAQCLDVVVGSALQRERRRNEPD